VCVCVCVCVCLDAQVIVSSTRHSLHDASQHWSVSSASLTRCYCDNDK